ncbi:MAG: hypothetical protein P4L84_18550 [Isosphaeraceae bacterium]|nr:hypothetical protein [Isosphaeraceae bacterium]
MRRSPALSAVLAAALILAGRTAQVMAAPIGTSYELINNSNHPVSEVFLNVTANASIADLANETPANTPTYTVLASTPGSNPVTLLSDSTFQTESNPDPTGHPFRLQTVVGTPQDTSQHYVLLDFQFAGAQDKSDKGPNNNWTGQNWSNTLLQPGQMVHFTLTPGYPGPLSVSLSPDAFIDAGLPGYTSAGLTLKVIKPSDNGGGNNDNGHHHGDPPPANTPEPLSVVLWSTLAGAGLMRARKLRRAAAQS